MAGLESRLQETVDDKAQKHLGLDSGGGRRRGVGMCGCGSGGAHGRGGPQVHRRRQRDDAARERRRGRPAGSRRPTHGRHGDSRGTSRAHVRSRGAKASTRFDKLDLPADLRRQLNLLKLSLTLATPADSKKAEELTTIAARLEATYGK
jgi:hypothetical protein